jgi:hypothetical protein
VDVAGGVLNFTRQTTELRGSLQDASGGPAPDYTVIVFPAEERLWLPGARRITATRPSTDGRFRLAGLPPGDYRIVAVTDVDPGQWFDAAFLRQLAAASLSISLAPGEKKEQALRVK